MKFQKPREIAARVLHQRGQGEQFVEELLARAFATTRTGDADRALVQELVYGVVRWQAALDWIIEQKVASQKPKPLLQIVLQLGVYQIFWLERIPDHAAVSETVDLAKTLGFAPQAGFVNALLRNCLRDRATISAALKQFQETNLPLGFSHPAWLCERWEQRWGTEKLRQLLTWNNTPPPTYARANTLRADGNQLRETWQRERVTAHLAVRSRSPGQSSEPEIIVRSSDLAFLSSPQTRQRDLGPVWDWLGDTLFFQLESHPPLATMDSFLRGLFYVQDPSTALAVHSLDPRPGERVLDLCAAPGGKATLIAQRMQNRGQLIAHDTSPARVKLLQENCTKLGATCCVPTAKLESYLDTPFDRVLVDAPCSNTGVMRRRIDLRWRIRREELSHLARTQFELLERAAKLVKPGGTLVYSTCSLEPEENSEVIRRFLTGHAGFELVGERTLLPFVEQVDGAYVAKLLHREPGQ